MLTCLDKVAMDSFEGDLCQIRCASQAAAVDEGVGPHSKEHGIHGRVIERVKPNHSIVAVQLWTAFAGGNFGGPRGSAT